MKHILWLSHMLPYPPKGGNLQRSYNLIRELSRHHQVTLVAFNQSKILDSNAKQSAAIEHFSSFCTVKSVTAIPSEANAFKRLGLLLKSLLPWTTYTVSWLDSPLFKKRVQEALSEANFDILYADTLSLAPYLLGDSQHIKVLNHHNIESQMLLRRASNEAHWLKKAYFFWEGVKLQAYEKRICKRFHLNVTCSDVDTERLQDIAGHIPIVNIPNGVDLTYFQPTANTPKKDKSLVFAGGLSWYPNLDAMTFFLKSVWPLLVEKIPGISFTLIGKAPPEWMKDLQNHYPQLRVTGFVDDVRPYLTEADIYICPIKDGGGTKLKVLDALAMGKPLVANPIACEGIHVQNEKNVIFASTPTEYLHAIQHLLENPSLKTALGANGQTLIAQAYSFAAIGEQFAKALENLQK